MVGEVEAVRVIVVDGISSLEVEDKVLVSFFPRSPATKRNWPKTMIKEAGLWIGK